MKPYSWIKCIGAAAMVALMLTLQPSASAFKYVAKGNESLTGIARKFNVSVEDLRRLNPRTRTEGVKSGMELIIPGDGDEVPAAEPQKPVVDTPKEKPREPAAKPEHQVAQEVAEEAEDGIENDNTMLVAVPGDHNIPVIAPPAEAKQDAPATAKPTEAKHDAPTTAPASEPQQKLYVIAQPGDTFQQISSQTGVPVDEIIRLNPFVDPDAIKPDQLVRLSDQAPYVLSSRYDKKKTDDASDDVAKAFNRNRQDLPETPVYAGIGTAADQLSGGFNDGYNAAVEGIGDMIGTFEPDTVARTNILVLLPFMANHESAPRNLMYAADFYRGFLIAAHELCEADAPEIEVVALDTENSVDKVRELLENTRHRNFSVIVAPNDEAQLQVIAEFAKETGAYAVNFFNVKDESYRDNPYVLQANIPQHMMYDLAIEGLLTEFEGYIPVILYSPADDEANRKEKEGFVNALRTHCLAEGIEVIDFPYGERFNEADLTFINPEGKYVFIPKTGNKNTFNKFSPVIQALRENSSTPERFAVFGYPDWTAFQGETRERLHDLGALIYSRFFFNNQGALARNLDKQFVEWYDSPMEVAIPVPGALGYDAGNFLIRAIQQTGGHFQQFLGRGKLDGVQSVFNFSHGDDYDGYVNESLYLILFLPDGEYEYKTL